MYFDIANGLCDDKTSIVTSPSRLSSVIKSVSNIDLGLDAENTIIQTNGRELFSQDASTKGLGMQAVMDKDDSADIQNKLQSAIKHLEEKEITQTNIDQANSELSDAFYEEMERCLPKRTIKFGEQLARDSRHRASKPWWNDELTKAWNEQRKAESKWRHHKGERKDWLNLRETYVQFRKAFDRLYQRTRRQFWKKEYDSLLTSAKNNKSEFWKKIGKIGINSELKHVVGKQVRLEGNQISDDPKTILNKWCKDYNNLFNSEDESAETFDNTFLEEAKRKNTQIENIDIEIDQMLNGDISTEEVEKAISAAKQGKAPGVDNFASEVFKSGKCLQHLTQLFNACFKNGATPTIWRRNIVCPIPKGASTDPLDPLTYRGLHLMPACAKLYCYILNKRIDNYSERKGLLADEQNGFRRKRNCMDHLHTLSTIAEKLSIK
jgi:hypothetical protein